MKARFLFPAILATLPATGFAAEFQRNYTLHTRLLETQDRTCETEFNQRIASHFEGLKRVKITDAPFTFSAIEDAYMLFTYAGVEFSGDKGDARGTITCILRNDTTKVETIAVAFEGRGLDGFTKLAKSSGMPEGTFHRNTGYASEVYPK